jgi:hypothetical protein
VFLVFESVRQLPYSARATRLWHTTQNNNPSGAKMANAQRTRKKTISATTAEDARVIEALKQASKEAKRVAEANKLPFIAGRKQSWSVPK